MHQKKDSDIRVYSDQTLKIMADVATYHGVWDYLIKRGFYEDAEYIRINHLHKVDTTV